LALSAPELAKEDIHPGGPVQDPEKEQNLSAILTIHEISIASTFLIQPGLYSPSFFDCIPLYVFLNKHPD
jgi:hypothetical protein